MVSATGDKAKDEQTFKNTVTNCKVPKVPDTELREKQTQSLKIELERNVTYTFQHQQEVSELINPEHVETVRQLLKPQQKLKSILKKSDSKPRVIDRSIEKISIIEEGKNTSPTEFDQVPSS